MEGDLVSVCRVTADSEGARAWTCTTSTASDEHGAFELDDVPRHHVFLRVDGEAVIPQDFPREELASDDDLELVVMRRCHLRVDWATGEAPPSAVSVLDGNGEPLVITRFQANGSSSSPTQRLEGGRCPVVSVSEAAETVLLLRGSEEVARIPVRLSPDEVTVIRP